MAEELLGPAFEIHGGGLDLVFPHHENEIAQSRALGHPFAKVWMHNGMLRPVGSDKMSKSAGNFETIREALERWGPENLLVFFLTAHWSKPIDYSDETLTAAKARAESLREVFRNPSEPAAEGEWDRFAAALDDDFNTPEALAIMHSWRDHDLLRRALDVFGLASLAEEESAPPEVVDLATRRQEARSSGDFAAADRLRMEIEDLGWTVRDVANGFQLIPRRAA
jgi:cysteinyl-tRNA synthetase